MEKKLAENKGKSWRVADIKGWITGLEEEEKWVCSYGDGAELFADREDISDVA